PGDNGGGDHQKGAEQGGAEHGEPRARVDEYAEQPGRDKAADPGANGVGERDGKRPDFQWEGLGRRQIGGAGRGRGKEEDYRPGPGLRRGGEKAQREEQPTDRQKDAGDAVGEREHGLAAERVEKAPENDGPQHVADGEGQDVPAYVVRPHAIEV